VAGSGECGDEPSGSGARDLASCVHTYVPPLIFLQAAS
jgi:hypothetical protein